MFDFEVAVQDAGLQLSDCKSFMCFCANESVMDIFQAAALDCYWEDETDSTPHNQLMNIWGSYLTCNAGTGACDRTRLWEASANFPQAAKDACQLAFANTSTDLETDLCTCLNEFDLSTIIGFGNCPLDITNKIDIQEMYRVCQAGGDPINPQYIQSYGSSQPVQNAANGRPKANFEFRGIAGCGKSDPFTTKARVACCLDQCPYPGQGWRSPHNLCTEKGCMWTTRMKQGGGNNCIGEQTYPDAIAFCAAQNPPGRLCTQAEMEGNCSKGYGCGNDGRMNWTRDVCPRN